MVLATRRKQNYNDDKLSGSQTTRKSQQSTIRKRVESCNDSNNMNEKNRKKSNDEDREREDSLKL